MERLDEMIAEQNRKAKELLDSLKKEDPDSNYEVYPPHVNSKLSMYTNGYTVFRNGKRYYQET